MARRQGNSRLMRADLKFLDELKNIQKHRIKMGKDDVLKPVKIPRLTLAMTRHPLFPKIKDDIIDADLK